MYSWSEQANVDALPAGGVFRLHYSLLMILYSLQHNNKQPVWCRPCMLIPRNRAFHSKYGIAQRTVTSTQMSRCCYGTLYVGLTLQYWEREQVEDSTSNCSHACHMILCSNWWHKCWHMYNCLYVWDWRCWLYWWSNYACMYVIECILIVLSTMQC